MYRQEGRCEDSTMAEYEEKLLEGVVTVRSGGGGGVGGGGGGGVGGGGGN